MLTQLLVSALGAAVDMHGRNAEVEQSRMQLRALELQLEHQYDIAEIQASLARDMIHALIERRIEAVQAAFTAVLSTYAEQARHYMQQQEKLTDAQFKVTDTLETARYFARLSEIDRQLNKIREESRLLYHEMNGVLLVIGGNMPSLRGDDQRALMLM